MAHHAGMRRVRAVLWSLMIALVAAVSLRDGARAAVQPKTDPGIEEIWLIADEALIACVEDRLYEPAHLPDGTPVPYPLRYAFTFRPDVL